MISVMSCLTTQHDLRMVIVAIVICLFGSYLAFALLDHIQTAIHRYRQRWLIAAALVTGSTVWTTHFVAMLAYRGSFPIAYDLGWTMLSIAIAIAMSWIGYKAAFGGASASAYALGGSFIGIGIGIMHFTGMAAIEAPARMSYDLDLRIAAWILGIALGAAALYSYGSARLRYRTTIAAAVMATAICTLHFTAMSALILVPDPSIAVHDHALSRGWLAIAVIAATIVLLLTAAAAALIDRRLTDLRGLADASLDGILIARHGRIIDANERISTLIGSCVQDMRARCVVDLLPYFDASICGNPVETDLQIANGETIPVEVIGREDEYRGASSFVLVIRDLRERKAAQAQIEHLAFHDPLTDLPNRRLFQNRLEQAMTRCRRNGETLAILCIDLDRFKAVNDTFGHAHGDALLCKVANLLRANLRQTDTIARLGGDEFAILQQGVRQPFGARKLAKRLIAALAAEMDMTPDSIVIGLSVGISMFPADGATAEELLRNADLALYRAKAAGRGGWRLFQPGMSRASRRQDSIERQLKESVTMRQLPLGLSVHR